MGYTLGFRLESTIQTVGMQGRRDGAGDEVDEEEEWQTLAYVHIEQVILRLHSPSHSSGSPAASALPFAWVRICTRVLVPLVFPHDGRRLRCASRCMACGKCCSLRDAGLHTNEDGGWWSYQELDEIVLGGKWDDAHPEV